VKLNKHVLTLIALIVVALAVPAPFTWAGVALVLVAYLATYSLKVALVCAVIIGTVLVFGPL